VTEERESKQKLFGMYAYPFNMSRDFERPFISLAELSEITEF